MCSKTEPLLSQTKKECRHLKFRLRERARLPTNQHPTSRAFHPSILFGFGLTTHHIHLPFEIERHARDCSRSFYLRNEHQQDVQISLRTCLTPVQQRSSACDQDRRHLPQVQDPMRGVAIPSSHPSTPSTLRDQLPSSSIPKTILTSPDCPHSQQKTSKPNAPHIDRYRRHLMQKQYLIPPRKQKQLKVNFSW